MNTHTADISVLHFLPLQHSKFHTKHKSTILFLPMFSHYSSENHQPSYCLQTGNIMKFISPNHIYTKDLKHPPQTHHSSCKWYFLTETNHTAVYSNISKTSLYIKSLTKTLATNSAALCLYCFLEKQHSSVF